LDPDNEQFPSPHHLVQPCVFPPVVEPTDELARPEALPRTGCGNSTRACPERLGREPGAPTGRRRPPAARLSHRPLNRDGVAGLGVGGSTRNRWSEGARHVGNQQPGSAEAKPGFDLRRLLANTCAAGGRKNAFDGSVRGLQDVAVSGGGGTAGLGRCLGTEVAKPGFCARCGGELPVRDGPVRASVARMSRSSRGSEPGGVHPCWHSSPIMSSVQPAGLPMDQPGANLPSRRRCLRVESRREHATQRLG